MSLTIDAPAFTMEPLSPVLGAAVTGLDLRQPLDEATKRAVYDAFVRYHVLCFRDQHLDPEQQIAFTEQFGTLERHMARNRGTGNPLVHIVSNLGADGKPSGKVASTGWHSDKSFRPEPSLATILHAQIMPPEGGETCFANMIAAYDALPDAEQGRTRRRAHRSQLGTVPRASGLAGHARGNRRRAAVDPSSGAHHPGDRTKGAVHGRARLAHRGPADGGGPRACWTG